MKAASSKVVRKRKKVVAPGKRRRNKAPLAKATELDEAGNAISQVTVSDPNQKWNSSLAVRLPARKRATNTLRTGSKSAVCKRKQTLTASSLRKSVRKVKGRSQGKQRAKRRAHPEKPATVAVSADCLEDSSPPPSREVQPSLDPAQATAATAGDAPSQTQGEEPDAHGASHASANKPKKKKQKDLSAKPACEDGETAKTAKTADLKTQDAESHADDAAQCLKICAANLPWWFDKAKIERHFRRKGGVAHVWLLYDKWGESRGVAFITFSDKASVKAALECDGTNVGGNVIRVNLAVDKNKEAEDGKPKGLSKGWAGGGAWADAPAAQAPGHLQGKSESVKGRGRGKSGKGPKQPASVLALPSRPEGSLGLVARGISYEVTEEDLKQLFSECGSGPTRVRVLTDKSGYSKGKAFIDFADEAAVEKAMKFSETMLKGRKLRLEYSHAAS